MAIEPKFEINFKSDTWKVPAGVDTEKVRTLYLQYRAWHWIAYNSPQEKVSLSEEDISAEFQRVQSFEGRLVVYLGLDAVRGK